MESQAEKSRRLSRKWKAEGRCSHCSGPRDNQLYAYCTPCRLKTGSARRTLIKSRVDVGLCTRCGKHVIEPGFKDCAACSKRNYAYQSGRPEKRRAYYRATKAAVFAAYGGRCACCGESEPLFLCIDHINNNGAQHRRELNMRGGTSMYTWLKARGFPPGYRLLCQNCNVGRQLNGGICPHEAAATNLELVVGAASPEPSPDDPAATRGEMEALAAGQPATKPLSPNRELQPAKSHGFAK